MKFTKFAIVLIFLLSVAAFVLTGFLSTVRENEKEKRISLQNIRIQLEDKLKVLEEEKQNYQKQVETLNSQLQEAISKSEQNATEIERIKSELAQKDQLIEMKKKDIDELQKAVQMSQDRNRELESTLEGLEKDLEQTRREQQSSDVFGPSPAPSVPQAQPVETKAQNSPASKPAPSKPAPVKAEPQQQAPAKQAPAASSESLQAGKVLLVNRKFNFVVVNIGVKQGLKIGDTFMVLDGNNKIARVEIEKLYDDFAAAKILEQLGDVALLKEGNLVTRV